MTKSSINLLFLSFWILVIYSCASVGTLEGGKKDETAPVLDLSKSTPNEKLNFIPEEIVLSFDEYINLKNPAKEIVVSPPISYPLETVLRGKTVKLKFSEKEVLKEDATYSINFGNAISDFNENNKLSNFSYVFSTGDYIDSLEISGTILDAFTKKPAEGVLVMLYDNLEDSIIYKERPFYFSRTDKAGKYALKNIKNDSFQIFVLDDKNLNYFFDQETESLGFMDSLMILTDSTRNIFDLEIFPNETDIKILSSDVKSAGIVKVQGSKKFESHPELAFSIPLDYKSVIQDDSLLIWYDTLNVKPFDLYLFSDTLKVKPKRPKKPSKAKLSPDLTKSKLNITANKQVSLAYSQAVIKIDTSQIMLQDTASISQKFTITPDSINARVININSSWTEGLEYTLIFKDSSLVSYNGISNDSIDYKIKIAKKEERGIIHFKAIGLNPEKQYVLKLVDKKLVEYGEWILSDKEEETITIEDLLPIEYSYYLISDRNRNGKWDTGNYNTKSQAEDVILKGIPKLKENWELEVPVSTDELN